MKTSHTFKPENAFTMIAHILGEKEADRQNESLNQYAEDYARDCRAEFVARYQRDEPRALQFWDQIEMDVCQHMERKAQDSICDSQVWALVQAFENALSAATVPAEVTCYSWRRQSMIKISVLNLDAMIATWRTETEGTGIAAWDNTLTCKDIEGLKMLANILDAWMRVHGWHSLARRYSDALEIRPDCGTYGEACKVADRALRSAIKDAKSKGVI